MLSYETDGAILMREGYAVFSPGDGLVLFTDGVIEVGPVALSDVKSVVPDIAEMRSKSDEMLANEIAKRVRQYVFYTIYDDVEGSVHDGVVTLTGKVTMPYKASDIGDLVARVPGVREVDNKISTRQSRRSMTNRGLRSRARSLQQ